MTLQPTHLSLHQGSRVLAFGFAITLFLLSSRPAFGQHVLSPGDPALRVSRVQLTADTVEIFFTPPDSSERTVAVLVRQVQRLRLGSDDLLRETERYDFGKGDYEYDTLDVVAGTLALRRIVEVHGSSVNSLRSDGVRLKGMVTQEDGQRTVVDTPALNAFHDMMNEAFIAAYPLDSGVVLDVPLIRPPSLSPKVLEFRVVGTEVLQTARGPVECLVVRSSDGATSWIARRDGSLVRFHWITPRGGTVWRLPKRDVAFRGSLERGTP